MSFQFAHIETYSRSGGRNGRLTITEIISEARRSPEASLHVENPQKPIHVYGCDFDELVQRHDVVISSAHETLANGKRRAVRKDTCSLFTCVLSHPVTPSECQNDSDIKAVVEAWTRDSVKWLRQDLEARGGTLESVIMHVDEGRIHLHAYGLHPSGHADRLHPGKAAKRAAADAAIKAGQEKKTANAIGDKAYVTAMRGWQDSYSTNVGLQHGLTRLGPARRRLSRSEWMRETAAAKSVQEAKKLADEAKDAAKVADDARIQSVAEAQEIAVHAEQKAKVIIQEAQSERDVILSRAGAELRTLRSIGNMLRVFWGTLRLSAIRKALQKEMQSRVDQEREQVAMIRDRLQNETSRRVIAEAKLSDAIHSAQALGRERDQARRERERLLHPMGEAYKPNGPKFR